MAKKTTKEIRKKKKRWIVITASKEFGNQDIGESLCSEPKELIGRIVSVSLSHLIRNPKKQNIKIKFRINDVGDEKAKTEVIGYEILPAYIKRGVRKGKSKIDDSFICESKDKIKIRIKPIILTRSKTSKSILNILRKKSREFFKMNIEKLNYSDVIQTIISDKLQREIKNYLKKIYPIARCNIRMLERGGNVKASN